MNPIISAITARAAVNPDRIAIDDGEMCIRYGELTRRIAAVSAMIRANVGAATAPVGIAIDNGIDWVLTDLSLLAAGLPCVPLPPFFTIPQREAALNDAGACAIVEPSGIRLWQAGARAIPRGTAKITYTSGSTGTAKGICLPESLMFATASAIVERFGPDMAGRHLPVLSLGVLLENVAGLYAVLLAGGTYAVRSSQAVGLADPFRLDPARMLTTIAATQATSMIVVPELLAGIVAAMEATGARFPLLNLVAVGGARVPLPLLGRAEAVGLPVVQGYGLTECGSVVSIEALGEWERGTTGRALGHVTVSLADDGEILVDGIAHLGTIDVPHRGGTTATGDIGSIDADGRLSIVGRKTSMLITGYGRNVAPEWIEETLRAQLGIAQAFVYGDGDAALSALLVATYPDSDLAGAVASANASLPAYAHVMQWRTTRPFMPLDGTLTANGRLRRTAILARETPMPFFNTLVDRTVDARTAMLRTPQLQAGLTGQIDRQTYVAYLSQAYHHVSHTVSLMREARARLLDKPMLVQALDEYIEEETGHEYWILNDIEAAGGDRERAITDGPSAATQAMVDHAYCTIRSGNPAAFFGMVFVLEGTSIAFAQQGAEAVQTSLGLPPEAFHYLTSHGALDQDHMAFFEKLMNRIDDAADQAAIIDMANAIFALFGAMFAAIPMESANAVA